MCEWSVESQSWEERCDDEARSQNTIHSEELKMQKTGDIQMMMFFKLKNFPKVTLDKTFES